VIQIPTLARDKRGAVYLNPALLDAGGGVLVPRTGDNPTVVAARSGTALGQLTVLFESSSSAWEEIHALVSNPSESGDSNRLLVQFTENHHGPRQLSNRAVNVNHVFGNANNPFYCDGKFGRPLLMPPQGIISAAFLNSSTDQASLNGPLFETTRIGTRALQTSKALAAQVNRETNDNRQLYPYWFGMENNIEGQTNVPGITLGASARIPVTFVNRRSNLTLLITSIMATTIHTGSTGDLEGVVAYEIFTPWEEIALQSQPVALNCGSGIGSFPHRLDAPLRVGPKETLKVVFTNLITNASVDLFWSFFGLAVSEVKHPVLTGAMV
jgi:hypothetical protein